MPIQLGVNIGPSFTEFCLIDTTQTVNSQYRSLGFQRNFSPSENLGASLKKFLSANSEHKISRTIVASNLLEKILATKLGGSVAQVITAGFECWPYLRQNLQHRHFEMQPQRTETLASQDLIFGVHERINSQGEIIQALALQELEDIAQKLSEKKIEKVCINFLFAAKNPTHLKQAGDFFKNKGFDVYCMDVESSSQQNNSDEILSWRKNLLNASLSGTFKEIRSEIVAACSEYISENDIYFFEGDSVFFQNDLNHISSSLFGPPQAMAEFYKEKKQVLALGTEKWYFLKPQIRKKSWESTWGSLSGVVPHVEPLKLQPTTELVTDLYDQITWGSHHLGYEPGPMSFGRGLNPTLLDILQIIKPIPELSPFTHASGISKLKSTLTAILKHSKSASTTDIEATAKELCDFMVDQIGLFILIERESPTEPVLCTGIFAPVILPLLKQRWPEVQWDLCPYSREAEAISIATRGLK